MSEADVYNIMVRYGCVGSTPIVPYGFVAFMHCLDLVEANYDAWAVPPERRLCLDSLPDHAQALGEVLATNEVQAVGIVQHTGCLVWAPPETWRMLTIVDGEEVNTVYAALCGKTIQFPSTFARRSSCYAILSLNALALIFRAKNPPAPPSQSLLDEIEELPGTSRWWRGHSPVTPLAGLASQSANDATPLTGCGKRACQTGIDLILFSH